MAAYCLQVGLVELERLPTVELPIEKTESEQRRMSFVEVVQLGRTIQSAQQSGATHSEHYLLAQSVVTIAAVQTVGEGSVPVGVLGELRVEQVYRNLMARD